MLQYSSFQKLTSHFDRYIAPIVSRLIGIVYTSIGPKGFSLLNRMYGTIKWYVGKLFFLHDQPYACVCMVIFSTDECTKFLHLVTQVHHSALLFCRKQQGQAFALVNFACCYCC